MRLFYSLAITSGLLIPTVSLAETYDALCRDNDCEITINEFGLSGPNGFIPKDKISQWYRGLDEYNLTLGAAGSAAGGTVGLAAATAVCFTWVLCQVALAVGVFGGVKVGSKLGKPKNVFFTVIGKKDNDSSFVQSFRF